MSNIKINDVPQRIQYLGTGGQTQYTIPFPFFQNNYIYVWLNGVQLFMGGSPGEYTVTGAGSPSGGLVTLNTPSILNDIITIEGIMPIDRTSIYSATISNLTGSDLNGDFNREVVMLQQLHTTQAFLQLQYAPWAIISQDLAVTKDRYIPILPPLGAWRKDATDSFMEYFLTPDSPGLAPNDAKYILQTANSNLPDAIPLDALQSGFLANTASFGLSASRVFEAEANQLVVTNADGMGGNPLYGIADNPVLPGTAGMGIPAGTTAQRVTPTPPSIGMRFNTDLGIIEAYIGSQWVEIPSSAAGLFLPLAGGTMSGDIDMDANFIHNLPDPVDPDDAATKNYVDTAVGGAAGGSPGNIQWNDAGTFGGDPNFNTDGSGNIEIDGSLRIDNLLFDGNRISPTSGMVELEDAQLFNALDANSQLINNLLTPVAGTDAANKNYVDAVAGGRYFVAPVRVAATANFAATYNNGASGVGATLTANVNGAAALDGVTLALNDRVIFSFQSSTLQNGIYTVTDLGSVSTPAVYTRATDYDQPADIDPGDTVGVTQGTLYAGAFFMETAIVTTIGTDPITFILSVNPNVVTLNTTQTITGNKTFSGTNQLGNFIFTANQMQHASDTDNYFEFGTDIQNFVTGNASQMDLTTAGLRLGAANSRVTTILNDGTMAANSATALATQQSIKTYADAVSAKLDPTIQKFTSGSGTYTTPTSPAPLYIRVVMVGGGGGGYGAGAGAGAGSAGGNTTFGTSLLEANGGASGGGSGGTVSLGSAIGIAVQGSVGGRAVQVVNATGGDGGCSAFGGAGAGSIATIAGQGAYANSGSGGGGAGGYAGGPSAPGGSSGGFVDAIIQNPASSYSYAVGTGGNGGTAGTGSGAGGPGGSGFICVYEYYQ